jgi:hypothetical protein
VAACCVDNIPVRRLPKCGSLNSVSTKHCCQHCGSHWLVLWPKFHFLHQKPSVSSRAGRRMGTVQPRAHKRSHLGVKRRLPVASEQPQIIRVSLRSESYKAPTRIHINCGPKCNCQCRWEISINHGLRLYVHWSHSPNQALILDAGKSIFSSSLLHSRRKQVAFAIMAGHAATPALFLPM